MSLFTLTAILQLAPQDRQTLGRLAEAAERQATAFEALLAKINEDSPAVDAGYLAALNAAVTAQAATTEGLQQALDSAPK